MTSTFKITIWVFVLGLLCGYVADAQNIALDRQLIGSGFTEYDNGSNFTLSASVGETVTTTNTSTNLIITQGFQQSNYILNNPFILELEVTNAACLGANDGNVTVTFISSNIKPPYVYQWSNNAMTENISQLEVGEYSLTVTGSNGKSVTNSVLVEADQSIDCEPEFYTGLTPNGDGDNDQWFIANADFFNQRKLEVFNRYGNRVWRTDNYDNVSDFFGGNHNNGGTLPDGTYYYVAEFDNSVFRGWLEIIR
jgi:gliding motility-associated-like protein